MYLDNHQEGVEQGEGFVDQVQDQGQEQEYLAEGKPFIYAYPWILLFYYLHLFYKVPFYLYYFGLDYDPTTILIQVPIHNLCIHLVELSWAMP